MAAAAVEMRDGRAKRRPEAGDSADEGSPRPKERRRDDGESGAAPEADSRRAKNAEALVGKTGGVYIPPAKLAAMRREIKDKSSEEYQKLTWEALKKSLNGLINKVNVSNIRNIIAEIFEENLVRGRGLLARAVMKAQAASPNFTHVYAALIAIINTKLPENGELLLKRVITQFKKAYRRNDKVRKNRPLPSSTTADPRRPAASRRCASWRTSSTRWSLATSSPCSCSRCCSRSQPTTAWRLPSASCRSVARCAAALTLMWRRCALTRLPPSTSRRRRRNRSTRSSIASVASSTRVPSTSACSS